MLFLKAQEFLTGEEEGHRLSKGIFKPWRYTGVKSFKSNDMKKLILTFSILLAGLVMVNAQDKTNAKATKLVDRINQACGLTSDQVSKLQPIAESYIKAREANKQQYANDPASLKSANKTNNQNYKAQLSSILTPDQQQKLKDYMTQQRAQRKDKKSGTDGDGE